MTTKRIYVCNLCRKETCDQYGIVGLSCIGFAKDLEIKVAVQCENHLCHSCLKAIKEVGDQGK